MELIETVDGMASEDYKERFLSEYRQLKIRCEKLKNFINKIEVAQMLKEEEPKHDCPLEILIDQKYYMEEYLTCLEKRAIIEKIDLGI